MNRPLNLLSALIFVLLLAGCGARATAPSPTNQSNVREPWFCQPGVTDDEWDCVQSKELAAEPRPNRLPKPRSQPAAPGGEPTGPLERVPPAVQAPLPAEPTPPPVEPDSPSAADAAQGARNTSDTENVPTHVRVSYQPQTPVPLLDLPEDFWAVQLVALSSKQALESWATEHRISGMSAARVYNGEKIFYVLLLGIYETHAFAKLAVASLPPPLDSHKPWIRTMGSLQNAMLASDQITGTAEI